MTPELEAALKWAEGWLGRVNMVPNGAGMVLAAALRKSMAEVERLKCLLRKRKDRIESAHYWKEVSEVNARKIAALKKRIKVLEGGKL